MTDQTQAEHQKAPPGAPLALQLAVRIEKDRPPTVAQACAAVLLATVALLDHPDSQPGGAWHEQVRAWNGARIPKIVRRGRGSAWERAQQPAGVTIESPDAVQARAYVPGPTDKVPDPVAKLQIQSTPLEQTPAVDALPQATGLMVAVTPEVTMTWGKQAAQAAHAGQRAWMQASPYTLAAWEGLGRPVTVVHPTRARWRDLEASAPVQIRDGGYTEIPAHTLTTLAWWTQPTREAPER